MLGGQMMRDNAWRQVTYEDNLASFWVFDLDNLSSINIYPIDFESKDLIKVAIEDYNEMQQTANRDEFGIGYTDVMDILMSSITSIINIITYVLIAFVAISLVVSSIMIAIITYISVLERTKEIGILRSIGASKKDISRVFNAETVIEGLVDGIFGVVVTMLLNIPINLVIKSLTGISTIDNLPWLSALILVLLRVIAGLVPAKMAANRDPVIALRSE